MRVAPGDIKFMVTGVQKVNGIPTPGIISQGHDTRQDAEDKRPTDGQYAHLTDVKGYVSNERRANHTDYGYIRRYAADPE